tara:strand:- start:216 stop:374 length:159 start_codon:yes stop_codon:yes gene_type:complete
MGVVASFTLLRVISVMLGGGVGVVAVVGIMPVCMLAPYHHRRRNAQECNATQ